MAVSYVARKCTQCAGKLEYIKEKKTWKCLYCGAEIERTEQYDGLFTIKNVVRQVLLDVAYRRLDSAQKNLVECEKIDSRYIGTIIAKIAYQMIMAITPGVCPQAEIRNLFSQLKRNYESLQAIDKKVSSDEEALYEFFDSADVYATLLLVYDSLNDATRRDYVAGMMNAAEVYAKEPNKNLLSYALKNAKFDLIDGLMANPDNVDPSFALTELLLKYPDNEGKIKNIQGLLKSQTFKSDDKKAFESYIAESNDSLPTKGKLVIFAYAANIKVSLEEITAYIFADADVDTVDAVLRQVCAARLTDEDVYKAIDFAIAAKSAGVAVCVFNVLKETNQYVLMPSKHLIALLSRTDLSAKDKSAVLNKMLEFNVDNKTKDSVINNYLCFNQDPVETRIVITKILLSTVTVVQTNTIESYVLSNNTDGEAKPSVVEQIFALDLNMSFFHDLLTKYMGSSVDEKDVKDKIIAILMGRGLKIDPKGFIDYICHSLTPAEDKIAFVKKMLLNGIQLRSDTVNTYLETITPISFNSELFALIVSTAINISEKALTNYLLLCKDRDSLKMKNFVSLVKQCHRKLPDIHCDAMCAGQKISGNLLPIYILATPDSFDVSKEIADYMIGCKVKLNTDIQPSGLGTVKLKKFISLNKSNLGPVSGQLCSTYKIG